MAKSCTEKSPAYKEEKIKINFTYINVNIFREFALYYMGKRKPDSKKTRKARTASRKRKERRVTDVVKGQKRAAKVKSQWRPFYT